jgi:hypothetical protein
MLRIAALILSVALSSAIAVAQSVTCAGENVPAAAAIAAEAFIAERWRIDGPHLVTAYEVQPGPPNPFDIMALKGPNVPPLKGFVWGQGLACRAALLPGDSGAILASYYVGLFSFHEGTTWSPPDRGGLIHTLGLIRRGDTWRVVDRSGDTSILLPGAVIRRPAAEDIPKRDRAGGIPCDRLELWTGTRCARPRP